MKEVAENIYVETEYMGSNVGCIDTDMGLVMIDCPVLPEEVRDWKEKLVLIGDKEIAYAISTDHHFDHCMTDGLFCQRIITQKLAYKGIKYLRENREQILKSFFPSEYEKYRDFFEGLEIMLPQVTFHKQMTLNMGDCIIELIHLGGHAQSTSMIYIPGKKVAFAGDNLDNGNYPFTADCWFGPWIEALKTIEQMEIEFLVPGHGEVCDKEIARNMRSHFEEMLDRVIALRRSGLNKTEITTMINPSILSSRFAHLPLDTSNQIAFDVARMYDQLERGILQPGWTSEL